MEEIKNKKNLDGSDSTNFRFLAFRITKWVALILSFLVALAKAYVYIDETYMDRDEVKVLINDALQDHYKWYHDSGSPWIRMNKDTPSVLITPEKE